MYFGLSVALSCRAVGDTGQYLIGAGHAPAQRSCAASNGYFKSDLRIGLSRPSYNTFMCKRRTARIFLDQLVVDLRVRNMRGDCQQRHA
jgi:hypothetical protein